MLKLSRAQRILAISLVVSTLLILLGFQQEGSQETPVKIDLTKIKTSPAKVIRVYDGDTIGLDNGESVRYIGIDTPETHHPHRPVEFLGKEATKVNRDLVGGKKVYLEFDVQKRDRYGRLLAYVFLEDGTFVNAELARLGYAQTMTIPPNVKYTELFRKVAREARKHKRGLWQKKEKKKAEAGKININTATQAQLETLPGIGPTKVQAIIAGRPYASIEELPTKAKGIEPKTYENLKDLITVK